MRSVSLTRQLPMWVSRVVPSANNAIAASVIAASGMSLQSSVTAWSGKRPRRAASQPGPLSICAPIARAASTKRMSPWIESMSTPWMRTGSASAAERAGGDEIRRRRGVAFDADAAGRAVGAAGRNRETLPAVALDGDAEAPSRFNVISTYGREISSPSTSITTPSIARDQRQRQQQRRQELARHIAPDADRLRSSSSGRAAPPRRSGGKPSTPR